MGKIGLHALSATCTSANQTDWAFGLLPQGTQGLAWRYWLNLPSVSAATCCASILQHDPSHNEIWRSDFAAKDHSTQAENTSAAANMSGTPIGTGDHFHVEWSARPSGDSGGLGLNTVVELKLYLEED